jgi:CheY-like chemotaxis protein
MRILLVEDNRTMARILERGLKTEGYSDYVLVESAEEALDAIIDQSFDLFILDWMLPGVSGLDLARLLRKSQTYHDHPIIISTAKDHSDHVQEAFAAGVDDYIVKPINLDALGAKLQKVQHKYSHLPAPPTPPHATVRRALQAAGTFVWTMPASADRLATASPPDGEFGAYSVEELLYQPTLWMGRVIEDDQERVQRALNALRPGTATTLQYRWNDKDNEVRWIQSHVVHLGDNSHAPYAGCSHDVTLLIDDEDEDALKKEIRRLERENEALQVNKQFLQDSLAKLQRAQEAEA